MSPWVFLKHFLKASGIMTTNARTSKLDMNGLYRLALMSLSLNSGYLFATGPDMTLSPWTASGSVISSTYKLSKYIPTVRRETTPVRRLPNQCQPHLDSTQILPIRRIDPERMIEAKGFMLEPKHGLVLVLRSLPSSWQLS